MDAAALVQGRDAAAQLHEQAQARAQPAVLAPAPLQQPGLGGTVGRGLPAVRQDARRPPVLLRIVAQSALSSSVGNAVYPKKAGPAARSRPPVSLAGYPVRYFIGCLAGRVVRLAPGPACRAALRHPRRRG
jgi:hypothetical protein